MTKKEYLTKICESLESEFPLFGAIKVLITNGNINNETIDSMADIFRISAETTKNKDQLKKLKTAILELEKIKNI